MTIRVLLADDDALLRAGLAVVLGTDPDLVVVAEAADGLQAVEQCRSHAPDVALMDIRLAEGDGIACATQLRKALGVASIFVSAYGDANTRLRAEDAVPVAFVAKPFTAAQIRKALAEL